MEIVKPCKIVSFFIIYSFVRFINYKFLRDRNEFTCLQNQIEDDLSFKNYILKV